MKKYKRKNPVDFKLLEEFGINTPLGLPDKSMDALMLGKMIGAINVIDLCEGNINGLEIDKLTLRHNLKKAQEIRLKHYKIPGYYNKALKLPSDAFMMGILSGIIDDGVLCLDALKTQRIKKYQEIKNNKLYKKYSDTRSRPKITGIWPNVKAYFGLKPR